MILVDDQAGSKDIYPYIKALCTDTMLTRIDPPYGDIVWVGNGPMDKPLNVAIEYKKIDDVLSCIGDGRFADNQVGGMVEHYDRRYLLVEGRIRIDRNSGIIQKQRGDRWQDVAKGGRLVHSRDLEHWFTTIEEQAQFRVKVTFDEHESARWVVNKHSWYTNKGWDEHNSLKQFYVQPPPTATFQKPNLVRRIAKELPSVGWDRSAAVAAKFANVREMINANEQSWQSIDGIGKGIARAIVAALTGVNK